ncbi:hypothetical protein A9Q86_15725 [Flavobacteriales bacterium 33_180_T64]|nr:hypothetical protein A9Q86_15725 [Flavobacteriales bacterium 33_180_T64]
MKKLISPFILVILVVFSCSQKDEEFFNDENLNKNKTAFSREASELQNNTTIIENELVLQYVAEITEIQKEELRLEYNVLSYEVCFCSNDIEIWTFEEVIQAEHATASLKSSDDDDDDDDDGILVKHIDNQFEFSSNYSSDGFQGASNINYLSNLVSVNQGVTIAVVDSGIDSNHPVFNQAQFLYNGNSSIMPSGWNFVNNDNNIYDYSGHGTQVSSIIHEELYNNIFYNLLGVKVLNNDGNGRYSDVVCGTQYACENADIVTEAFGWHDDGSGNLKGDILSSIFENHPNVLVVTSAGNNENDNDILQHYPSSYTHENIIAVAASNTNSSDIASFSNYGGISVDFYAKGEGILFYDTELSGTSFSASYVAARAAAVLYQSNMSYSPAELIDYLDSNGTPAANFSRATKYSKVIE